jgi:hypothetical protein
MTHPVEPWPWPDSLDALVAAPRHHELVLEDERVRVIITHIRPGEFVPVHTHRWPAVAYLLSWSHFIRRDPDGNVLLDSRGSAPPPKIPFAQGLDPLPPHTVENVGDSDIRIYLVELKERS